MKMPIAPKHIEVKCQNEERIWQKSDKFFDSVLKFLGYQDEESIKNFVKRQTRPLSDLDLFQKSKSLGKIRLLIVRNFPVALTLCIYNQSNQIEATYVLDLDQEKIEQTKHCQETGR